MGPVYTAGWSVGHTASLMEVAPPPKNCNSTVNQPLTNITCNVKQFGKRVYKIKKKKYK